MCLSTSAALSFNETPVSSHRCISLRSRLCEPRRRRRESVTAVAVVVLTILAPFVSSFSPLSSSRTLGWTPVRCNPRRPFFAPSLLRYGASVPEEKSPSEVGNKNESRRVRNEDREASSRLTVAPMMEFMEREIEESDMVGDHPGTDDYAEDDDDLVSFVETVVRAADMRKAEDVVALKIDFLTSMASYMIFCSGSSRPQVQAIAAAISSEIADNFDGRKTVSGVPEGTAESGWILLDYGDVVVHVMTPKSRLFYDVEGRWKKGIPMDLSGILVPNTVMQETDGSVGFSGGAAAVEEDWEEEDDPFWS